MSWGDKIDVIAREEADRHRESLEYLVNHQHYEPTAAHLELVSTIGGNRATRGQIELPEIELVDWADLYDGIAHVDPIVEGILIAGRWTQIPAPAKTGKSSLLLSIAVELAQGRDPFTGRTVDPHHVVYLDPEMGRLDMLERLEDLNLRPEDLSRFHYTDLVPKLNTLEGAAAINKLCEDLAATVLVIDGINGVVIGAEKDDTTWRPLYDLVIAPAKQRGRAIITGDNTGKDKTLGSRGSSIKNDKPDGVLMLSRTDTGIRLTATHRRTAAYPLDQFLTIAGADGSEPIRYRRATMAWPHGTQAIVEVLEEIKVPVGASRRAARRALKDARDAAELAGAQDLTRYKVSDDVLGAALRWRQQEPRRTP